MSWGSGIHKLLARLPYKNMVKIAFLGKANEAIRKNLSSNLGRAQKLEYFAINYPFVDETFEDIEELLGSCRSKDLHTLLINENASWPLAFGSEKLKACIRAHLPSWPNLRNLNIYGIQLKDMRQAVAPLVENPGKQGLWGRMWGCSIQ